MCIPDLDLDIKNGAQTRRRRRNHRLFGRRSQLGGDIANKFAGKCCVSLRVSAVFKQIGLAIEETQTIDSSSGTPRYTACM